MPFPPLILFTQRISIAKAVTHLIRSGRKDNFQSLNIFGGRNHFLTLCKQ